MALPVIVGAAAALAARRIVAREAAEKAAERTARIAASKKEFQTTERVAKTSAARERADVRFPENVGNMPPRAAAKSAAADKHALVRETKGTASKDTSVYKGERSYQPNKK